MLPKYVRRVRSKGKDYYYFDTGKRVDGKKVYSPLPDLRSPNFGGSYAALMGHRNRGHAVELQTVPKLIDLYERSQAYRHLSDSTRKLYGIYLLRLAKLLPTAPANGVARGHIRRLLDGMADTPGAANAFLRTVSALYSWAKQREYVTANPCDGIEPMEVGEHQPWPPHILAAALKADDPTTRLLANLLYFTAQRLGDVLAMAWTDINDGTITIRQRKTGKALTIPIHRELSRELAEHRRRGILVVTDDQGAALKDPAARYKLQKFTEALGERCVPHGLRKNAVNALLEAGCSIAETSAISGQTLRMVEHYARARNQEKLAGSAVLKWEGKAS